MLWQGKAVAKNLGGKFCWDSCMPQEGAKVLGSKGKVCINSASGL